MRAHQSVKRRGQHQRPGRLVVVPAALLHAQFQVHAVGHLLDTQHLAVLDVPTTLGGANEVNLPVGHDQAARNVAALGRRDVPEGSRCFQVRHLARIKDQAGLDGRQVAVAD